MEREFQLRQLLSPSVVRVNWVPTEQREAEVRDWVPKYNPQVPEKKHSRLKGFIWIFFFVELAELKKTVYS